MTSSHDPFGALDTLSTSAGEFSFYRLDALQRHGDIPTLPYSIRVLLESCLRNYDDYVVTEEHIRTIAGWKAGEEIPFKPGRVVLQDFTGVPAVVDLAALRSAMDRLGGDPQKINPLVQCDLVVDHSVQVDAFAQKMAIDLNVEREFERNRERYEFLKWGQQAFRNFRVVPPATGIVHQVNLEYLATGVLKEARNVGTDDAKDMRTVVFPDSLVGTDSHTTMINGLGVLGWGVGGIEAEAVMLGQPIYMLLPEVVGFRLEGELPEGATATDLVLTVTQMLRSHGVVGKFVEFYGPGLSRMSLPDRATIANMAPEYGATMGFFPVDAETLRYMERTGRDAETIELVEAYYTAQGLFRTEDSEEPRFTSTLALDMGTVEPSLAGPKRPQDRITLAGMQDQWEQDLSITFGKSAGDADSTLSRLEGEAGLPSGGPGSATQQAGVATMEARDVGFDGVSVDYDGHQFALKHGAVVIAAITSCTNTSNPSVMVAAGLVAKKAAALGLSRKPWVKTSLAPGSRVVTDYLKAAGLDDDLDALGFHLVGYGCTTCIGNSGPLPDEIAQAITDGDLVASAVLSGNRNFEGRISPHVRANYLASPPLVVAYAIAGTVDIDMNTEPLGKDSSGQDVFLADIWPTQQEIADTVAGCLSPEMFRTQYSQATDGPEQWQAIDAGTGELYGWNPESTYVQEPPFFVDMPPEPPPIASIEGARCLVSVGDSTTTDHISPAGAIKPDSPAGRWLQEQGVAIREFNSYGSRRGNDRVMTRGTFANIRLRNLLAPGTEGSFTTYWPGDGPGETGGSEQTSIYDASMRYQERGVPLVVLAGTEYGTGSSRDWAAKGTFLLGVKAVIAESFERIHRSNLVGMGVLPLQFREGDSRDTLGLDGTETFEITLDDELKPRQAVEVTAIKADGSPVHFVATCRIDTPVEVEYYRNGGILHTVLRKLAKA